MAFRQNRKKVRPIRPPAAPTLSQAATERFPTGTTVLPPSGAADQAADMMTPTPMATPGVGELVGQFQEQGAAARAANEARYTQGLDIHKQLGETSGAALQQTQEQESIIRAANEAKYAQGMGIHEQLVEEFGQGGTLQAAMMGQYQQQKERDLAAQKQHMIGSGLMNTTIAAGMPSAYEERVGTPYKMQMADLMAQRQAEAMRGQAGFIERGKEGLPDVGTARQQQIEAMRGQAGFIERREDTPPSPELMASLVQTASARPEDVAAGDTTAEGAPTTSTEIAAGGVPNMADVAGQHAFTPPTSPTAAGGPIMPGFAKPGSGWGGGGSSGGVGGFANIGLSSAGGGGTSGSSRTTKSSGGLDPATHDPSKFKVTSPLMDAAEDKFMMMPGKYLGWAASKVPNTAANRAKAARMKASRSK